MIIMQVYLVTGGYNYGVPVNEAKPQELLQSTELLFPSRPSWTNIDKAKLRTALDGLRGARLDNKILVTGTNIHTLMIV